MCAILLRIIYFTTKSAILTIIIIIIKNLLYVVYCTVTPSNFSSKSDLTEWTIPKYFSHRRADVHECAYHSGETRIFYNKLWRYISSILFRRTRHLFSKDYEPIIYDGASGHCLYQSPIIIPNNIMLEYVACMYIIRMVLVQGRLHGRNLEFIVTPHYT